jgi:hypothetical protein
MKHDKSFKDFLIPMLLNKTYVRCGKVLQREISTAKKYASTLCALKNKCRDVSDNLAWIETHLHSFLGLYGRVTNDRTTLRRYIRELTALRAGAEILQCPHVVEAYGSLASALQRKVMGQEITQEQDSKEKVTYKSFDELRKNAACLANQGGHPWLLYELMVPEDGSYALRLDAMTLRKWDGKGTAPDHNYITMQGDMHFYTYKTSKFKQGAGVSVAATTTAKRALQTLWTQSPTGAHLFTDAKGNPYGQPAFSKYVQDAWILDDRPAPNAQNIRSAIVTHFMNGTNNLRPSLLCTKAFATRSMTSPAMMEMVYHKIDVS